MFWRAAIHETKKILIFISIILTQMAKKFLHFSSNEIS